MVFGQQLAQGALSDTDMLRALESMGMDGVELWAGDILESPARSRAYQVYLASSMLRVTCIDAIGNFATSDPQARQKNLDTIRRTVALAYTMNCPLVLTAGSRLEPGVTPEEGRKRIIDTLNEVAGHARQAGVTLMIEDFGIEPLLQCSAQDCLKVLDGVEHLAFTFDTGNFYFAGDDALANLETLWPYIKHVHFKDWVRSATPEIADVASCPVGAGLLPNQAILKRLVELGYKGALSLETGGTDERMRAVQADLETLRGWL